MNAKPCAVFAWLAPALALIVSADSQWALASDEAWSALPSAGPSYSSGASVYDPDHRQMLRFGGSGDQGNQTWALPLEDPSPTWNLLSPAGDIAPGRTSCATVWDPARGRMLIFGGEGASVTPNELWAFTPDPPAWTRLFTTGSSGTTRFLPGLAYDPPGDRLVMFGGNLTDAATYVLPLSGPDSLKWSVLPTLGTPPGPRRAAAMIFDPLARRVVLMDGVNDFDPIHAPTQYDDLWTLHLGDPTPTWVSWSRALRPSQRSGHVAALDPTGNRLLVMGGRNGITLTMLQDTWSLSLADLTWTQLTPTGGLPSARRYSAVALDPNVHRPAISGGSNDSGPLIDTWFLDWTVTTAVDPPGPAPTFGLGRVAFDRGAHELRVAFRLPSGGSATLGLFDLGGRRMAQRTVQAGDGAEIRFDVHGLPSGVYFLELAQSAGWQASRKVTLVL